MMLRMMYSVKGVSSYPGLDYLPDFEKKVRLAKNGVYFVDCEINWNENRTAGEIVSSIKDFHFDDYRILVEVKNSEKTVLVVKDNKLIEPFCKGRVNRYSLSRGTIIDFDKNKKVRIRELSLHLLKEGETKIIKENLFRGDLPFERGEEAVLNCLTGYNWLRPLAPIIMEAYRVEEERLENQIADCFQLSLPF